MRKFVNGAQLGLEAVRRHGQITVVWANSEGEYLLFLEEGPYARSEPGPIGHSCSPWDRVLFIDPGALSYEGPQVLLHEVAHTVLHPPMLRFMDDVCEGWILMQAERTWARVLGSEQEYRRVVDWQEDTTVHFRDGESDLLGNRENYETSDEWLEGFENLVLLGVLDADLEPTWRWPDWSRLPEDRRPWTTAEAEAWTARAARIGHKPPA